MASLAQQIAVALKALTIGALPTVDVVRNPSPSAPPRIGPGGLVTIEDGDPGQPEVDLCPVRYNYQHRFPVQVLGYASASLTREEFVDQLLQPLVAAVMADRTLGGLVDFLDFEAPTWDDLTIDGAPPARAADCAFVATYATSTPL